LAYNLSPPFTNYAIIAIPVTYKKEFAQVKPCTNSL